MVARKGPLVSHILQKQSIDGRNDHAGGAGSVEVRGELSLTLALDDQRSQVLPDTAVETSKLSGADRAKVEHGRADRGPLVQHATELSHQRFTQKYNLPFPLLSDVDAAVSRQYGVYKEKNLYGRSFWGIERTTFVVDRDGKVENVFRRVKVEGHADEVLATLAV